MDDEPDNSKILRMILEPEGYRVDEAENGEEALEKAQKKQYDLYLLDIVMPGMDGYALCKELKEKCGSDTPYIFVTGKSDPEDIMKGFEMGAVDYLTKPFKSREIKARVKAHIDLKKARDSLREKYEKEKKLVAELKEASAQVKTLSGLLPICCYCFKIKDDKGYWQRVDDYMRSNSEAEFTHGICDECREKTLKKIKDSEN